MFSLLQVCLLAESQLNVGPNIELRFEPRTARFRLDTIDVDADVSDVIKRHTTAVLTQLCDWRSVIEVSQSDADVIAEFLLKINEHGLARKWVDVFAQRAFLPLVDEAQVLFLLEGDVTRRRSDALRILEDKLSDDVSEFKSLCSHLMEQCTDERNTSLVADFLLREAAHALDEEEEVRLRKRVLGCDMLQCVNDATKVDYRHLVDEPLLLFEQLLMNAQVRAGLPKDFVFLRFWIFIGFFSDTD